MITYEFLIPCGPPVKNLGYFCINRSSTAYRAGYTLTTLC